jgi:hypothetical protein
MRGRELIVGHELCSSMDEFSPVADSGSLCPDALATKPQKTCPNSGATSTQKTCPNLKRLSLPSQKVPAGVEPFL